MSAPLLTTKLYLARPRENMVVRARLRAMLDRGLTRKLTLVSAPAGFGKTTLVGDWCRLQKIPVAWLSLDASDNYPARFLSYLVASMQTIAPQLGSNVLAVLQAPQPPPPEAILISLLNEIAALPHDFILALDDYHLVENPAIDDALEFLVEQMPPQMHLVIATREDPSLPLAHLRARDQLTELRAADLRFTLAEATEFLNEAMGLELNAQNIAALEARTEGWAAGLQLAALALQSSHAAHGPSDAAFIESFTSSHRFVLDYLLEQVLHQQSPELQNFLLCTSILERMCGPLCDAVLETRAGTSESILAELERANLFVFPLDNERRWYRYHHLFGELLRQRLPHHLALSHTDTSSLHQRASAWFENNALMIEAFQHAVHANDIDRAARLIESGQMPLHFPGAVRMILDWLDSLPRAELETRPLLALRSGSLALVIGITTGVDEKLQAAESALQNAPDDDTTRNLHGEIASARATLALTRYQFENIFIQAQRALEYLRPDNYSFRTYAYWASGIGYFFIGNRAAAHENLTQALAFGQAARNPFAMLLATLGLGVLYEVNLQFDTALETYHNALRLAGDPALSIAYDAYLGMARIAYERNDLDAAERLSEKSAELAYQYDRVIDRFIVCEIQLARVQLARGDTDGAAATLARIEQTARTRNFLLRLPEIAAAQIPALVRQKNLAAAAQLAQTYNLPLGQARVLLAQGDTDAALRAANAYGQFAEQKDWHDERLRAMILQMLALDASGDTETSLRVLDEALALAEPPGTIRLFADEGEPMRRLLADFKKRVPHSPRAAYVSALIAAFAQTAEASQSEMRIASNSKNRKSEMYEPLTERENEILQLIAQGYSNQEICERLFLALSTVKGYNRTLFDKLGVKNRTEAVAVARAAGLL